VHIRRTTGIGANRRRIISVAVGPLLLVGFVQGGASVAAAAVPHSAATQTSAVQLVQQYLSALGLAGSKLSKVEIALKALGSSVTRAQVLVAVASLGLLWPPSKHCWPPLLRRHWRRSASRNLLAMRRNIGPPGKVLISTLVASCTRNGFQVDSGTFAMLNWPTHDRYASLSAQIGMDGLNTNKSVAVSVSFRDSTNTAIPFFDHGKLVFQATVPMAGLVSVSVPVAHESAVRIVFSTNYGSVVDVVNDRLS
jgi:hypothetical protein